MRCMVRVHVHVHVHVYVYVQISDQPIKEKGRNIRAPYTFNSLSPFSSTISLPILNLPHFPQTKAYPPPPPLLPTLFSHP